MPKKAEHEMPFLDHLEELRHRLFWIFGALFVGVIVGLVLVLTLDQIMIFLQKPIMPYLNNQGGKLVILRPLDNLKIPMLAALVIGITLALPVVAYQVWSFLSPGLHKHEQRVMKPLLFAGGILFAAGVLLCFQVVLPFSLRFMIRFGEQFFTQSISAESYFGVAVSMSLAFGAMFELPVVVVALTLLDIVNPRMLNKFRRYAIVVLLVISAILTPPDIFSLSLMFGPIYLLYELSVLVSYIIYRKKEIRIAAEKAGQNA